MGVKRTVDSGRVDSLGRPIMVSGKTDESSLNAKAKGIVSNDNELSVDEFSSIVVEKIRENPQHHLSPYLQISDDRMSDEMWDELLDHISIDEDALSGWVDDYDVNTYDKDGYVEDNIPWMMDSLDPPVNLDELHDVLVRLHEENPYEVHQDAKISVFDCDSPSDELVQFIKDDFSGKEAVAANIGRELPYLPKERLAELAEGVEFDSDTIRDEIKRYGSDYRDGGFYMDGDYITVDAVAEGVLLNNYHGCCNIDDVVDSAKRENEENAPRWISEQLSIDESEAREVFDTLHDALGGRVGNIRIDYLIPEKTHYELMDWDEEAREIAISRISMEREWMGLPPMDDGEKSRYADKIAPYVRMKNG